MSKGVFVRHRGRERPGLILLLVLIGCCGSAAVGYAAAVMVNSTSAVEYVSGE